MSESMPGKVYLVGAGPGDPELLTVKALRILHQADLLLRDDLVPTSILSLAPPGARIVNVGKRCGVKSVSQVEINQRMIVGARKGLTVVRLKGGDPSFFGRAGEEIEALREAGVDFEIIPGVTAACAAAAAAGISLTHRDMASTVVLMTGHRASARPALECTGIDSRAPAGTPRNMVGKTVVIYMPGPNYEALQTQLQAAGTPGETPCLFVSTASAEEEQICKTTVEQLTNTSAPIPPCTLIVGEVTRYAHNRSMAACKMPKIDDLVSSIEMPFRMRGLLPLITLVSEG